ncbi:hypothetical protein BGE01nite_54470 [Brevifollis gellanilyticus]|uniref:Uncharacterized protein n=1 Tax=Brevifollis gellanilyticus TaxID=748831 RepID=A0A512MHF1_9BACT|nr:hypothetical protein BGE01nite_54470 [Brevifollis gellanilyticus]
MRGRPRPRFGVWPLVEDAWLADAADEADAGAAADAVAGRADFLAGVVFLETAIGAVKCLGRDRHHGGICEGDR